MPSKVGHSIWIPYDLDVLVRDRAKTLGLGYNNVIIIALHQMFNLDQDPMSQLMYSLRIWLMKKYNRINFPPDVTLEVFRTIQQTPKLLALYNEVVASIDGPRAQATLNRRIGQAVSQLLQAEVTERKVEATGCSLIKGYSRLTPQTKTIG